MDGTDWAVQIPTQQAQLEAICDRFDAAWKQDHADHADHAAEAA
jgi:hypothetical protein